MLALKYLLVILGIGLFGSSGALVVYDIYLSSQLRRLLGRRRDETAGELVPEEQGAEVGRPLRPVRWGLAQRLAAAGVLPLLVAYSIVVVPDGFAGVRVSQIWGARPGTLYPGVHLITPLVDSVELYDTREQVYTTAASYVAHVGGSAAATSASAGAAASAAPEVLTVQAREGLNIGLAVSVRYRLDPQRLSYIHANLPRAVGDEVVAPTVATIYRQLAPNYITREIFATKREELRLGASNAITSRLASDGIIVREVLLRDLKLPEEYAQGLEGLLLKEQENERLGTETEIKQKQVKIAELEAEAQKSRDVKQAEAQAQVRVLQAKAESDSMQYTLPLKQKQIEQSKLEAQARKEATLQNAEAAAQAKVIDSKAELERQKNLSDAEANRIRVTAAADAERMKFEAAVLKQNPMLIQKIIAERLSDKLQIMMVPIDGKNFFANDVLRSAFSSVGSSASAEDPEEGTPVVAAQKRSGRRP
ncbi:MAG TPA: SPFH domain-containing protein [Candidatus Acidoferrum sp.]|nr:SPFH domain-containing protein [Candidatus Acidoferrum sp.]